MEPRANHQFNPFGPQADAYDDVDISHMDFSDPATISKLLGVEVKTPSPADVLREAKERSTNIFNSYHMLHEIIIRHEATIRKRWAKKTKQQRLKILLSAWPGMAAMHRPDFEAFRKESGRLPNMQTRYKEYFMWPHINQEDLSQPKTLPLLLNARGRHPPSEFAGADEAAMHLGHVTKALVPIFLNEHTMIINGATNAQDYGKLVSWDDHPDAFDWVHTRKQYLPGEGLHVLEAQERLLAFLVECCKQILHEIPADTLTTDAFPIQPEPLLQPEGESGGFNYLAIMAAEAPYRVPAYLDLERIESLLDARTAAAEDHLWALREDPSYFAAQLLETKEHRLETLKDIYGNIHPTLRPGRDNLFWARVIGGVVFPAYLQLEVFSELRRQVRDLQRLQRKYQATITPTRDLPEEYLLAILKFRHYVNQAAKGPMGVLKNEVPASPPLRRFFIRKPPPDNTSSELVVLSKPDVKMDKVEQHLIWLLQTLWEDGHSLFLASMPLVLDELERLLQADKSASELVSGRIAGVIGDLSIISQCLNQLNLYLPWSRNFETALVDHEEDLKKDFAKNTTSWAKMMAALKDKNLINVAKLGDPSDKKFFYPADKRRTKDNVQAMRQAERSLDDVWAAVDRIVYSQCGSLNGTALRQLLSQPRIIQRTPEWVDEKPAATQKKGREPEIETGVDSLYRPLSTLYFGLPTDVSKKPEGDYKVKPKTRGTPQEKDPAATTASEVDSDDQPASIPVDAKSLKVFRTVFFNPDVTSTPGEIAWSDFLHAMTSTGLFSAEKLYGSVWQFQKSDGLGRIQFHEPHPRGKIPFTIARRHGRRLNRAFGWVGEMFKLKQKDNA
ncbi:hypothetical protein F5Y06DRAFT_274774 [Hypoxylon sp. FL0890]|nr:hypothetical protein F5Y06DRAFT_274774 [Hypoxylon sp. FL0890]